MWYIPVYYTTLSCRYGSSLCLSLRLGFLPLVLLRILPELLPRQVSPSLAESSVPLGLLLAGLNHRLCDRYRLIDDLAKGNDEEWNVCEGREWSAEGLSFRLRGSSSFLERWRGVGRRLESFGGECRFRVGREVGFEVSEERKGRPRSFRLWLRQVSSRDAIMGARELWEHNVSLLARCESEEGTDWLLKGLGDDRSAVDGQCSDSSPPLLHQGLLLIRNITVRGRRSAQELHGSSERKAHRIRGSFTDGQSSSASLMTTV